jgi:hypothetical protein
VYEGIRQHDPNYRVIAQNYPLFLWKDNIYDDDSPFTGFLRSALLVKVRSFTSKSGGSKFNSVQALRHIAISPSSADSGGNRSSKKGYAALNGINKVTVPAIAYSAVMVRASSLYLVSQLIAMQVHFALSSEENFSENGGGARRFSYRQFYLGLIETVRVWSEDDRDGLLLWWNRCVVIR